MGWRCGEVPGQKLVDAVDGMIGDAFQHMTQKYTSAFVTKPLPAVSCRVLLKQHFAQYLEEM
jgi:hypothetical protein